MKTQFLKSSSIFAFAIVLLLGAYSTVTLAQNKLTYDKLGTKVVDYTLDHDVISLGGSQQTYTGLKIVVNNGSLNVHKATIHFANGDTQDAKLPDVLSKENDGKLIDLQGNKRVIEKVTFWYDTKNSNNDKAVVEVWGKK
jgi:hypothetical protein